MASTLPRKDKGGNIIGWQARVGKKGYPLQVKTLQKVRIEGLHFHDLRHEAAASSRRA